MALKALDYHDANGAPAYGCPAEAIDALKPLRPYLQAIVRNDVTVLLALPQLPPEFVPAALSDNGDRAEHRHATTQMTAGSADAASKVHSIEVDSLAVTPITTNEMAGGNEVERESLHRTGTILVTLSEQFSALEERCSSYPALKSVFATLQDNMTRLSDLFSNLCGEETISAALEVREFGEVITRLCEGFSMLQDALGFATPTDGILENLEETMSNLAAEYGKLSESRT